MVNRWFVVFLAVMLASVVALAQHTGGSFGGSRWGSGARVSRPSVVRPTSRPSYRPAVTRPSVSRPSSSTWWRASRPTQTTHVGVVVVPIGVHHDAHDDEPSVPSEPWSTTEKSILAAVFLIAFVVVVAWWWLKGWE